MIGLTESAAPHVQSRCNGRRFPISAEKNAVPGRAGRCSPAGGGVPTAASVRSRWFAVAVRSRASHALPSAPRAAPRAPHAPHAAPHGVVRAALPVAACQASRASLAFQALRASGVLQASAPQRLMLPAPAVPPPSLRGGLILTRQRPIDVTSFWSSPVSFLPVSPMSRILCQI